MFYFHDRVIVKSKRAVWCICQEQCGSAVEDGGRSGDRNCRQQQARDSLPVAKNVFLPSRANTHAHAHARTHTPTEVHTPTLL